MYFLVNMVNKGRQYLAKNNNIDLENIVRLNLEKHNIGTSEIEYLNTFKLKNLRVLDLNSNAINAYGAYVLSQGEYNSLKYLNISNNKIGNEGINHIAIGHFKNLNCLHLSHDFITYEGIKFFVKNQLVDNLTVLSLSDNRKIEDTGIRYIKEHKGWGKLKILNLDLTGLSDVGLSYLEKASMPNLRELNILNNKFTENAKSSVDNLRKKNIKVRYKYGEQ